MVPCLRAATIASLHTSGVDSLSAQNIPPVCSQREPSLPKISSQSICPGLSWLTAVCPRSEQPSAARTPKPRSVKFNPLRVVRPTPSYFVHTTCDWSTPPCNIRSSIRRPTGLSASAVTTAVFNPKQRRKPRATLYSPPPSHTRNWRAVATRTSPGSSRSITSPRLTRSHLHSSFLRITRLFLPPAVIQAPIELLDVLLRVLDRNRVHVCVVLVLSAHAPAEAIVLRPYTRMNRPPRRHHHLLIRHHDVAGSIRRTHQVHDALIGLDIEVEVNLGPPHVRVCWHGVPVAAWREIY